MITMKSLMKQFERQRAGNYFPDDYESQQALINSMTNWQNSQWTRAGAKRDKETVTYFANMHHSKDRHAISV